MEKARPRSAGEVRLVVRGYFAAFRSLVPGGAKDVRYDVVEDGGAHGLPGVQWADWHPDGRLLLATVDGRLQIARWSPERLDVETEIDVGRLVPDPAPPPAVARQW